MRDARSGAGVMHAMAIAAVLAGAGPAAAERDMCGRHPVYRGHRIDLDVKDADLQDVLRLLSDAGNVNLVVGDGVHGSLTMRLRSVPWDQVLCTVARLKRLRVTVDGNVVMVRADTADP